MDINTTIKKIIFFLLDMLLLMGAIAGILTIDGGRWLISNPAFYQPPEEAALSAPTSAAKVTPLAIPVTGIEDGVTAPTRSIPQPASGCPAESGGHQVKW